MCFTRSWLHWYHVVFRWTFKPQFAWICLWGKNMVRLIQEAAGHERNKAYLPCCISSAELLRKVVTPTFSRPHTCFIYWALACMYAKLCFEKELLGGTCVATWTLLTDSHPDVIDDCTLDKRCRTESNFTTGNDEKLQPEGMSTDMRTLRTAIEITLCYHLTSWQFLRVVCRACKENS